MYAPETSLAGDPVHEFGYGAPALLDFTAAQTRDMEYAGRIENQNRPQPLEPLFFNTESEQRLQQLTPQPFVKTRFDDPNEFPSSDLAVRFAGAVAETVRPNEKVSGIQTTLSIKMIYLNNNTGKAIKPNTKVYFRKITSVNGDVDYKLVTDKPAGPGIFAGITIGYSEPGHVMVVHQKSLSYL